MKKTKKMLIAILSALMVIAMSVPAFAGTITINDAIKDQGYTAYKILYYETSGSGTSATHKYYLNSTDTALKGLLEQGGMTFDDLDSDGHYVLNNASDFSNDSKMADLTSVLEADFKKTDGTSILKNNYLKKTDEVVATGTTVTIDTGTTDGTGYWFINTSTGTVCSLVSVNDTATAEEKNETPVIDKEVKGGSASDFVSDGKKSGDTADNSADVGDELTYSVDITKKKGAKSYVFTDILSTGLTLGPRSSLSVKVGDTTVASTNYEVNTFTENTAGDGETTNIKITFTQDYLDTLADDTVITISYTATVNADAKTIDSVNNTAKITYGDKNTVEEDYTKTDLYGFKLKKLDENGNNTLTGAKFTVSKTENGTTYYYQGVNVDGTAIWGTTATNLEVGSEGTLNVQGIQSGTYTVTETKAPDGYNKLSSAITVTITDGGTISVSGNSNAYLDDNAESLTTTNTNPVVVNVKNNKGGFLPDSGGIGTTILYAAGGILIAAAVAAYVMKKRKGTAE